MLSGSQDDGRDASTPKLRLRALESVELLDLLHELSTGKMLLENCAAISRW